MKKSWFDVHFKISLLKFGAFSEFPRPHPKPFQENILHFRETRKSFQENILHFRETRKSNKKK